jgi:hypothetical protein
MNNIIVNTEIELNGLHKIIELNGVKLLVFESGIIYRYIKSWPYLKLIDSNRLEFNRMKFYKHQIMSCAFRL